MKPPSWYFQLATEQILTVFMISLKTEMKIIEEHIFTFFKR